MAFLFRSFFIVLLFIPQAFADHMIRDGEGKVAWSRIQVKIMSDMASVMNEMGRYKLCHIPIPIFGPLFSLSTSGLSPFCKNIKKLQNKMEEDKKKDLSSLSYSEFYQFIGGYWGELNSLLLKMNDREMLILFGHPFFSLFLFENNQFHRNIENIQGGKILSLEKSKKEYLLKNSLSPSIKIGTRGGFSIDIVSDDASFDIFYTHKSMLIHKGFDIDYLDDFKNNNQSHFLIVVAVKKIGRGKERVLVALVNEEDKDKVSRASWELYYRFLAGAASIQDEAI
jgi:hypothetical protein